MGKAFISIFFIFSVAILWFVFSGDDGEREFVFQTDFDRPQEIQLELKRPSLLAERAEVQADEQDPLTIMRKSLKQVPKGIYHALRLSSAGDPKDNFDGSSKGPFLEEDLKFDKDLLLSKLIDGSRGTKFEAIRMLKTLALDGLGRNPASFLPMKKEIYEGLSDYLENGDYDLAIEASKAILAIDKEKAISRFVELMDHNNETVRSVAISGAARSRAPGVHVRLLELAQRGVGDDRVMAISMLPYFPDEESVKALEGLLNHSDREVANVAGKAYAIIHDKERLQKKYPATTP